jgi:hypothetical protein
MFAALHVERNKPHQDRAMRALAAGLRTEGLAVEVCGATERIPGADFEVIWGSRHLAAFPGRRILILGGAYTTGTSGDYQRDRLVYCSAGWDKPDGEALSAPPRPADRWHRLGLDLLPWAERDGYALILGQCAGDLAVPGDYAKVLAGMKQAAAEHYGPVRVRKHPLINGGQRPLAEDLAGARLAITWTSTSAVEAVLAGVPTITFSPQAIAWPVTSHALGDPPYLGDRGLWCYDLAYRQWTLAELTSGEAWEHLSYGIADSNGA